MTPSAPVETTDEPRRKMSISAIFENPRLPSLPAIALQIVDKASNPGCELDEIITLLRQDSGMCGRVLKTVNSGLFALSRPVSSLKSAVMLLGLKPLRSLVLSAALPAVQISERDELIAKYWRESVAGAVIARQLAVHLRRPAPDDDLVAGLLRDLGILVLREGFPGEYRQLWQATSTTWAQRQCEAERAAFGVDHTEIGACLLESWNLPQEIFLPVRFHHDPDSSRDAPKPIAERAWLLHFAAQVASLEGDATPRVGELVHMAQRHFGMDQPKLQKFLDSVAPAIGEFAGILNVDIGACPSFSTILSRGCEALVRLSLEASRPESAYTDSPDKARHGVLDQSTWSPPAGPRRAHESAQPVNGRETLADFDISCLDVNAKHAGFRLNGYEIKEVIGRGGMGVVFKAHDPLLDRFVAVKMLTPERLVLSEARERFLREARTSAAIQHENVIAIHAVGEINGIPYIVMEYVLGLSLEALVERQGPLPIADVVRYGRQIAAGLHAAHLRKVVHRDIKPANILLARDSGSVKITDFGLARVADTSRLSQDGMWVGTPLFMAPEQFNGPGIDHRADLFSLGSLLYTLCAGAPPFSSENVFALMKQVCTAPAPPLRLRRAAVPAWLESLIRRLHEKSPAARFQSAADVVHALEKQS